MLHFQKLIFGTISIRLTRTFCRAIKCKLFAELWRNNEVTVESVRVTIDSERSLNYQDFTGDLFCKIIGEASEIFLHPLRRSLGEFEVNVISSEVPQCYTSLWRKMRKKRQESLGEVRDQCDLQR